MRFNLERARLMNDLVMPVAIILIFIPSSMAYLAGFIMPAVYLMQKAVFLFCAFYFLRYRLFENKSFLILLGYIAFTLGVTYYNGEGLTEIGSYLNLFSLCVMTVYCLKSDALKYTCWVSAVLTALIAMNTLLWKQGGTYVNAVGQECFLLGTKTSITEYQITASCYISLYLYLLPKKEKYKGVFLLAAMSASIVIFYILQPVSTSVICLALYLGLLLIQNKAEFITEKVLRCGFWATIGLNIGIVFFNVQLLFSNFITSVLHEQPDLNYRTAIWQVVMAQIVRHPVIGRGVNSGTSFAVGSGGVAQFNQATHNHLLYLMFIGGAVGTVYFFILCIMALRKSGLESVSGRIIHITLICFGTMWIAEQLKTFDWFFMCLLAGSCADFIENRKAEPGKINRVKANGSGDLLGRCDRR